MQGLWSSQGLAGFLGFIRVGVRGALFFWVFFRLNLTIAMQVPMVFFWVSFWVGFAHAGSRRALGFTLNPKP